MKHRDNAGDVFLFNNSISIQKQDCTLYQYHHWVGRSICCGWESQPSQEKKAVTLPIRPGWKAGMRTPTPWNSESQRGWNETKGRWVEMKVNGWICLNLLYKSSMLVFLRWFLDVTWKQVCKWLPLWLDVFCLDGFDEVEPMKDFLKNLGNQETGTRTRLMWTLYQGFNAICRGMKTLDKNNVLCWSKNVLFVASSHWSRP